MRQHQADLWVLTLSQYPNPLPIPARTGNAPFIARQRHIRCLISRFDGAIFSQELKEALCDKFVKGAPRPRTPSERRHRTDTIKPTYRQQVYSCDVVAAEMTPALRQSIAPTDERHRHSLSIDREAALR